MNSKIILLAALTVFVGCTSTQEEATPKKTSTSDSSATVTTKKHNDVSKVRTSLGYKTVSEALNALQKNPSVNITQEDGWTVAKHEQESRFDIWSFTPDTHPAHPAAVKRSLIKKDEEISLDMNILCEAPEVECQKLANKFIKLTDEMAKQAQTQ